MALDPDSYLPEFFTEERLGWYRRLYRSYRMWCGAWPLETRDLREYEPWDPHARLADHAAFGDARPFVFWRPQRRALSESFMPEPVRGFLKRPDTLGEAKAPNAILSAIRYTCHPWHLPENARSDDGVEYGPEQMLNRWSRLIDAELTLPPEDVLATIDRHFGLELAQRREAVLKAHGTERTPLKERLTKTWEELGEAIGLIPTIARGRVLQLRGEPLGQLLGEGAALVHAATAFEVSEEEVRATRYAVQRDRGLDPVALEMLASLQRQNLHEDASRIREEKQRTHLGDEEVRLYARWFRFPILNRAEVEKVASRPERDSEESYSLARDFILGRWRSVGLRLTSDAIRKAVDRAADTGGRQRPK